MGISTCLGERGTSVWEKIQSDKYENSLGGLEVNTTARKEIGISKVGSATAQLVEHTASSQEAKGSIHSPERPLPTVWVGTRMCDRLRRKSLSPGCLRMAARKIFRRQPWNPSEG